jgi:hypothetical protein
MSKKTYLTLLVIVVLIVASVTAFYLLSPSPPRAESTITVGVKAGDVFTYKMVGYADSHTDFDIPENFVDVNKTDYYRVEITKVDAPIVSYTITLQFNNGTKLTSDYMVNLENGLYSGDSRFFWDFYSSNLSKGDLSRPGYPEEPTIAETQLRPYPDGDREINFLRSEYEWYDSTDQTFTNWYLEYNYVYFDKQTGMIVEFTNMKIHNYPEIILTVEYELVSSNVIKIS